VALASLAYSARTPGDAQSHTIELAAPAAKQGKLMLVFIMWAVSTLAGFLAANYF
jgi:hypothetical protein